MTPPTPPTTAEGADLRRRRTLLLSAAPPPPPMLLALVASFVSAVAAACRCRPRPPAPTLQRSMHRPPGCPPSLPRSPGQPRRRADVIATRRRVSPRPARPTALHASLRCPSSGRVHSSGACTGRGRTAVPHRRLDTGTAGRGTRRRGVTRASRNGRPSGRHRRRHGTTSPGRWRRWRQRLVRQALCVRPTSVARPQRYR